MALIGNLNLVEIAIIMAAAVMIFGRNLPRVVAEVLTHLAKAKRAMRDMWRETGIEQEMRKVQGEMRRAQASLPTRIDPASIARDAAARWIDKETDDEPQKDDGPDEPEDKPGA
jgi:Sec-independent protein translocase protein TatA